ncbi:MAG TPA: hypothetical protein VLE93_03745 [Candidatus Saccharimonadales bacterium]|nr:hypothetical protein [Candidatus Saccharimonadales bacterium]
MNLSPDGSVHVAKPPIRQKFPVGILSDCDIFIGPGPAIPNIFVGTGLEYEDNNEPRFVNPMPALDELVGPGLPGQHDQLDDEE